MRLPYVLCGSLLVGLPACSGEDGPGAPSGGSGGSPSAGAAGNGQGGANSGGTLGGAGSSATAGTGGSSPSSCTFSAERLRVSEVELGAVVVSNEDEAELLPLVIAPAGSGSRVAWMGDDGHVHATPLDENDRVSGVTVSLPAHDFSDLYADEAGGVLLLTRDAQGGGTGNCGSPSNLCGTPPNPPVPCFDMYLVRFDGSSETWATKLTSSSSKLPPYSTSRTGPTVYMIWWYAHHGRIAFDGQNYASYFGSAISVSEGGCINIHQGDRMQIVGPDGTLREGGFAWGCSHSGYERIIWDPARAEFVMVCKTDNQNRIAFAPDYRTIYPVDLAYSNLGNLVLASGSGYWLTTSNIRPGQPAGSSGMADVHLLHFESGAPDRDLIVAEGSGQNHRAPHLAQYGENSLLVAWESSTEAGDLRARDADRQLYVQVRSRSTGEAQSEVVPVDVPGNRYQDFRAFPDGSVAYAAPGDTPTSIKILRVLPCSVE